MLRNSKGPTDKHYPRSYSRQTAGHAAVRAVQPGPRPHGRFKHWDFVSTTPADLQKLTAGFGLSYSEQAGQIPTA